MNTANNDNERLSPEAARDREDKKQARFIGAAVVVAVVLLISLVLWLKVTEIDIDEATGCPEKLEHLTADFVLLLDATDSYSGNQRRDIEKYLKKIESDDLPVRGRISTAAIGEERLKKFGTPLCNRQKDANRLFENRQRVRNRRKQLFYEPFESQLNELLQEKPKDRSPLLEQIQEAAKHEFSSRKDSPLDRRLYLISDLLHHTLNYSHYNSMPPDFEEFRGMGDFERYTGRRLDGVKVHILYIHRKAHEHFQDRNAHLEFWKRYFEVIGAKLVDVEPSYQ